MNTLFKPQLPFDVLLINNSVQQKKSFVGSQLIL